MTVVSAATTSTTNITGFLAIVLGSSLAKAAPMAGSTIFGSSIVATGMRLFNLTTGSMEVTPKKDRSERGAGIHRQMLDDRAKRQRREESEAADDEDHADHEADEQTAGGREGAARGRNGFLPRQRAGHRHRRNDHEKPADEHRARKRQIVEERVRREPGKGRAVIASRRGVGVKHFGEAVRPGIVHRGHA